MTPTPDRILRRRHGEDRGWRCWRWSAYALLLDTLGFVLSSFLFLVAITPLFGRPPLWMWLAVPAVLAVAAHIAFVVILRLRLPAGLLPL